MKTLYITEAGMRVHRSEGRLSVLSPEGDEVGNVQMRQCSALVLFGGVEISRGAADLLAASGKCVHLLTRGGRLVGTIWPAKDSGAPHRVAQILAHADPGRALGLARWIIVQKLRVTRCSLAQRAWDTPDKDVGRILSRLDRLSGQADLAPNETRLRGIEGRAARLNFEALNSFLPTEFRFKERSRRPPRDPFNALLSLGYTLATTEILSVIRAKGLDPYVGFFHNTMRNNPALALDLVEPFRPALAERWAMNLVRLKMDAASDFVVSEDGGVRFADPTKLRKSIAQFRNMMDRPLPRGVGEPFTTCRKGMGALVDSLIRALAAGEEPEWSMT